MPDLSTSYLGLALDSPLMLGACSLSVDVAAAQRAERAGASAIVMRSLFEEQLESEAANGYDSVTQAEFSFRPVEYLEQVRRLKSALRVPVIASVNGTTSRAVAEFAALLDQAGADALELNVYRVVTDADRSAESIESEAVDLVRATVEKARIPVAVKLSPFYTCLPHFARQLVGAGARGLVVFNRFYQPDIDPEQLDVEPRLELSLSSELGLRLRWLAILSANLDSTLAVTGGVHSSSDALKAVLAGAHGVQLVSEILLHGVARFGEIRQHLAEWLSDHGYDSLEQVRGSVSSSRSLNPEAFERASYVHVLHSPPVPPPSCKL